MIFKKYLRFIFKKLALTLVGTGISKYKVVYRVTELIKRYLKPDYVEMEGSKILLDKNDSYSFSIYDEFDSKEINLIKNMVREGAVCVDVGANIGIYTVLFAKLVKENGHVFSFEPELTNYSLLNKTLKINQISNVTIIPKAVSDISGKMILYLYNGICGHSMIKVADTVGSVEVDTISLDDFFIHEQSKIDFIKIDAEGFDFKVIKGMKKIFQESDKLRMLVEFYPTMIRKAGDSPSDFLVYLLDHGFSIIDMKTNRCITKEDIERIVLTYNEKPNHLTNLFCEKM